MSDLSYHYNGVHIRVFDGKHNMEAFRIREGGGGSTKPVVMDSKMCLSSVLRDVEQRIQDSPKRWSFFLIYHPSVNQIYGGLNQERKL